MNTRLHLTVLATVFAFLTPATSTLHAQVLAATDGIDVPDGTRKCIKPKERAPRPTDLFTPLTCLEAVANVSATAGNQAESFVNVNPTNTNNIVATSNDPDTPSRVDAASLQKKATQAQARIHANKDDRDQLMSAIKTNEVALAKQVLLRNGFTAEDLENAKITLRTGGGKGGEDEIEISATCCDPKEITIQRSLEYFTK